LEFYLCAKKSSRESFLNHHRFDELKGRKVLVMVGVGGIIFHLEGTREVIFE